MGFGAGGIICVSPLLDKRIHFSICTLHSSTLVLYFFARYFALQGGK
jgi:hypothetical protein